MAWTAVRWAAADNAETMMAATGGVAHQTCVLAACAYARVALPDVPAADAWRPRQTLEAVEAWARGASCDTFDPRLGVIQAAAKLNAKLHSEFNAEAAWAATHVARAVLEGTAFGLFSALDSASYAVVGAALANAGLARYVGPRRAFRQAHIVYARREALRHMAALVRAQIPWAVLAPTQWRSRKRPPR